MYESQRHQSDNGLRWGIVIILLCIIALAAILVVIRHTTPYKRSAPERTAVWAAPSVPPVSFAE